MKINTKLKSSMMGVLLIPGIALGVATPAMAAPAPSTFAAPSAVAAITGNVEVTATMLNIRAQANNKSSIVGTVKKGTILPTTGVTSNGWTQVVYKNANRWVNSAYVKKKAPAPAPKPAPVVKSYMVTSVFLNVRAMPTTSSAAVGVLKQGAIVQGTGVTQNGWVQITYGGTRRWVSGTYLTTNLKAPASNVNPYPGKVLTGYTQLTPSAKAVVGYVFTKYPTISTIYGWRASSDYSSDHPNGKAVDIMISNYKNPTQIDLGWKVAHDLQAKAKEMNISYIIYQQRIWNVAAPERGWRLMENRGNDTQNHFDHVHVSMKS